jgi:hypothetical protein
LGRVPVSIPCALPVAAGAPVRGRPPGAAHRFLDMMEQYFEQPEDKTAKDIHPEFRCALVLRQAALGGKIGAENGPLK